MVPYRLERLSNRPHAPTFRSSSPRAVRLAGSPQGRNEVTEPVRLDAASRTALRRPSNHS